MYFTKMFMEESGSLSYLVGCVDEGTACVINPKRDVLDYLETAGIAGMKITHIFDTRKPEDSYLNGNMEMMLRTGAKIYYLNKDAFQINGTVAAEGDAFNFGNARLEIIESPCHDLFSGTIRVSDTANPDEPWVILGRDSLFVGNLVDEDTSSKAVAEELSCYLDTHEEYGKSPSMMESMCQSMPGLERDNPVYASTF